MKRLLLVTLLFISAFVNASAQNVFDPNDPQIRFDINQPLGSTQRPDPSLKGLQKWVSTPSNGISSGNGSWDNSSYKAYFLNIVSSTGTFNQMPYRIKFPKSWLNPDSVNKKYPVAVFFHGAGEFGCPTNNGFYNNEKQLVHGGRAFRDRVDKNQFDGFLVYPQNYNPNGCYGEWPGGTGPKYANVVGMIDSLAKYVRADIDRIFAFGLSSGGYAAWTFAMNYPTRVAKIAPTSAVGASTANYATFAHIPVWFATGGKDINPSPTSAQNQLTRSKNAGGFVRYTLFPDRGHDCWNQHWAELDFVPFMNSTHKANPTVFFQRDAFCPEDTFNTKIGITGGYAAYEWTKDDVLIARQVGTTRTIFDAASIALFEGNNITVRSYGTYKVRFKRSSSSTAPWSEWSPIPAVIRVKPVTSTPPITVDGLQSIVVPAPDGSKTATLKLADNFYGYQWYRVTDNGVVASTQKFNAPPGVYKAKVFEQYGCGTTFSPVFQVVDANGSPKPDAAKNLTAFGLSKTSVQLDWSKNPNPGVSETGFEIYRATKAGGPYKLIFITNANVTSYLDNNLPSNAQYFYVVRAVNNTGAAALTNEATAKTISDNVAPSAPKDLLYRGSTTESVDLRWTAATDDVGVVRYDVYGNNSKLFSTTKTSATVFGIDSLKSYTFYVKAIDAAGNVSPASNQVIGYTHRQGLNYKYYTGTWSTLPNFTALTPVKTGTIDTVNSAASIRTVSDKYGMLWEGFIYIPVAGSYIFETYSDDGSKLYIDVPYSGTATALVNNDGLHGATYKSGSIQLTEGYHSIAVTYFDGTGGETMQLLWSCAAANISRELIPKNYLALTAGPAIAAPPTPSALTATASSFNKINLTWPNESASETGFEIVRSLTVSGTYVPAGNVGANVTQFTDSGLSAATAYFYKVRALSLSGNSGLSPAATATTSAIPAAPATPGTPVVSVLGSNAVKVTFADNSASETGFEIWRSSGGQSNFRKVASLDANPSAQVTFNDNGLFANVTYFYQVKAIGVGGSSAFSPSGSGTTQNTAPQIAAIPNFTMKFGTSFTLPLKGNDPDGDQLGYQASSLPTFAAIGVSTGGEGTLVFNPKSTDQGTFTITARVTDGKATASTTFTLTVNNNSVPTVAAIADIYMSEGATLTVPITSKDSESVSQLVWEFQGQPSFASFVKNADGTGSYILKPGFSNSGVYSVNLKVTDPNGAWTSTPINVTVYDKDPNETIQVNFRNFTGGVPSWNDVQLQQTSTSSPTEPYFVANNLFNSVGNNTGVSIRVVSGVYKASQNGQVTGLDIGVYPDNVIRDQINWGWGLTTNAEDTVVIKVSNLSNLRKYDFTFFGSYQSGLSTSMTTYKIGATSVTNLYYQNTSNTATIPGVTPDANGEVIITMIGDVSTSRGGVLNALVIKGLFQDGTIPAKAIDFTGTVIPNAGIQLNWTDRAYNETNYKVYRAASAAGPWTFINTVGNFRDSTSFLDPNVAAFTTYYYYVAAINTFGQAPSSDIISVTTGNVAPVITGLSNIFVKTDGSAERAFTVTDSPGDIVSVTAANLPAFVKLVSTGGTGYKLTATPSSDNIGQSPVTIIVSDNQGGIRSQTIVVNVADKLTRSFFVNFGSIGKTAPLPWTNWLSSKSSGSKVSSLKDENQVGSTISLTSLTRWSGLTDLGMLTGNNSGAYPDSVLASGIFYNSTGPMQLRYAGLNPNKRYNVVIMSSMNEGLDATVEYTAGTERDTLNASYNTNRTANLNGLVPDSAAGITVSMNRIGNSAAIYVNGMVLEEYDPVTIPLNPANVFAQPIDKNSIAISWSDRSNNENPANGFELQQATDSLFTQNVVTTGIPGNKRNYVSTGLTANTRYWFRMRAVSGSNYSVYSNRAKAVTPQSIVYINFNYQLANASSPWNNLAAVPNLSDVFPGLKNQSGTNTGIQLAIERGFNGEFTAGKVTGNNSGVVPDNVLASNFWLDNTQLSTMRVSGLNQSKRYRFGFIGSSSAPGWYKGDYTATYTINNQTVYLNSWENASKIVYIADVVPDANGDVLINFSTTKSGGYGFNAGMVISTYDDPTGGPVVVGTRPALASKVTEEAQEVEQQVVNKSVRAYPNPFVDNINIDFFNSSATNQVSVEVYDMSGRLSARKDYGEIPAGMNTIRLNSRENAITAGVYIINLSINGKPIKTTKMVKTNK